MKLLVLLSIFFFNFAAQAKAPHNPFLEYLADKKPGVTKLRSHVIQSYQRNIYDIEECLYDSLLDIAKSQAEVWNDTILEEQYQALGDVRLDKVEQLTANGEVLGYYISYSQPGWDISKCDLGSATSEDLVKPETFSQCAEGRISESTYVPSNLSNYFVDREDPVKFKPKH